MLTTAYAVERSDGAIHFELLYATVIPLWATVVLQKQAVHVVLHYNGKRVAPEALPLPLF